MPRFLIAILLAATFSTGALAQAKTYNVMMILFRGETAAEKGFQEYLKARLPVNLIIRDVDGDRGRIRQFVTEAKQIRVDLIYTFGTTVTLDVVGALGKIDPALHVTDIPVVFNIVADPVGAGIALSFAGTGRNVTGVSHLVPLTDQIGAMQRLRAIHKLGVIYNVLETNSLLTVVQLRRLAEELQFEIIEAPLVSGQKPTPTEISAAMRRLIEAKPDMVYLPSDSSVIDRSKMIVGIASVGNVPVISATEGPIRDGGALMGLVINYTNAGAFAGYKAEQILLGKGLVGRIPIETLQRFSLLINMTTAKELGIYPPLDLIKIAELF